MRPKTLKRKKSAADNVFIVHGATSPRSTKETKSSQSKTARRFFTIIHPIANLANYPNFWQLVIDGRFHKYGETFFDTDRQGAPGEPGYVKLADKAFRTEIIPNLGNPLTVDIIINLHDALIDGLAGHEKGLKSCENKGVAGSTYYTQAFPVFVDCDPCDITMTADGAKEIYSARLETDTRDYYPYQLCSLQSCPLSVGEELNELVPVLDDDAFKDVCDLDGIEDS